MTRFTVFGATVLQAITTESMFASDARRANGLCLVATDVDWRSGAGTAEVSGPAEALIMTVMGRPVQPGELSGSSAALLS